METGNVTMKKESRSINGSLSSWVEVFSSIKQGSVLGLVLFGMYVNDLPDLIGSLLVLFADETYVYSTVNTEEQHRRLQEYPNNINRWSGR